MDKSLQLEAESLQLTIDNCLHLCLQLCANMAVLINPFLPNTAKKMCYMMKVVEKILDWENVGSLKLLSVGYSLRPPELLFRKIEDAEVKAQVDKLQAASKEKAAQTSEAADQNTEIVAAGNEKQHTQSAPLGDEGKPEIQYDDFSKLDLRIGTITASESGNISTC